GRETGEEPAHGQRRRGTYIAECRKRYPCRRTCWWKETPPFAIRSCDLCRSSGISPPCRMDRELRQWDGVGLSVGARCYLPRGDESILSYSCSRVFAGQIQQDARCHSDRESRERFAWRSHSAYDRSAAPPVRPARVELSSSESNTFQISCFLCDRSIYDKSPKAALRET